MVRSASWLEESAASTSSQMLCASPGSFNSRYRSALTSARGTASGESGLSSNMLTSSAPLKGRPRLRLTTIPSQHPEHLGHRVVQSIDDTLFERDERVVGDGNPFRTH